jgi:hypothetical protein
MIIGTSPFNISINLHYLKTLKIKRYQNFGQLENIDQILNTPQKFIEKDNTVSNSQDDDYNNVSVAIFNDKAYWVKNNNIYTAFVDEDGDIDVAKAEKIDVFSLNQKEVTNLLKIIDKIKQ